MIALGREHGFALYVAVGTVTQGCVLVQRGELEEGIVLLTTGLAQYRATGSQILVPFFLGFLAEAYWRLDKVKEGLEVLSEALRLSETNFDRFWEAELYRLKGELVLQSEVRSPKSKVQDQEENRKAKGKGQKLPIPNPQSEAEACFLKAIEIARQQGAKSLELRAVMSLSRLWQRQGKKPEARQMLAEIYEWFTEGFDTKDLQEAKALLATLT